MRYNTISNEPFVRHRITPTYCYFDGLFSEEELILIEEYCDKFEKIDGEIDSGNINSLRKSKIQFFEKNEHSELIFLFNKLNNAIWNLNGQYYNFDLNGYSYIQYTTYTGEELGEYAYHIDMHTGGYDNMDDSLLRYGDTRKLSLSLILSDSKSYEGGEFKMMLSEIRENEIEQKRGRIILFPSFLLHKVCPVTKGIRKSIVAWVEGPKFK